MEEAHKKSVLIVEDEETLQRILTQKLEQEGFAVFNAHNGTDGLTLALHQHPDLILLDIVMPHDGITMLEELRRDQAYGKGARVIFLTNQNPDTERIIAAIEKHEPMYYLVKANTTPASVVEKIKEVFAS